MRAQQTRIIVLFLLAAVSLAATCDGPAPLDLDAKDGGRFAPSGRVAVEILPGTKARRRGGLLDLATGEVPAAGVTDDRVEPRPVEFILSIAGEFATVEGRDHVPVPSGRVVDLGGEISGPARVATDIENRRGHVTARPGVRFMDMISIEGLVGMGVDDTEVTIRSGGQRFTDQSTRPGFLAGIRVSLRPVPLFDLYGQATMMLGRMFTTDLEVGAQLNLTRNLGLYGGYRRWTFREESLKKGGSDGDFELDGPTAGVSLTF